MIRAAVEAFTLLALLYGTLLAVHWNDARRWWASFGRALQDIDGREQA